MVKNKRFGNSIDVKFDISEEIDELATVKLILQPIVENAILHGILEKEDKMEFSYHSELGKGTRGLL